MNWIHAGPSLTAVRRACMNARRTGEIRADIDVEQVSDYVVGSVLGRRALARSPAPISMLRHYLEGVLGVLDGLRRHASTRGGRRSGKVHQVVSR